MKRPRIFLGFLAMAMIALFVMGCASSEEAYQLEPAPDGTLTIFHTNDTHARVTEGKYAGMGFAKVATLIEETRAMGDPVLYLDAGDTFHGQTFATLTEGESIVQVLDTVGLDLLTPGNHDFNYGYDRLLELRDLANFKVITANVVKDGKRDFPSYAIIEKGGYRIGVFGITTPETAYKTHPNNVEGVTFQDPTATAQRIVSALEGKVHLIVALGHIGIDDASEKNTYDILESVEGIDLFIDGHSHSTIEGGMMVGDTLLVQTGEYDKNLGKVTITFDAGEPTLSAELISKEAAADLMENEEVAAAIAEINTYIDEITSEMVGETSVALEGAREYVRTGETNLGNLASDAMLAETGADVAFTNGGGIRGSIAAGSITVKDIITVFPFGNYVVTKDVTGAELLTILEHGIRNYPATEGGFPHIAGMELTFNSAAEPLSKITSLTIQGKPVMEDMVYTLATNDFLAAGGDGYTMLKDKDITGEYGALDEVLKMYIQMYTPIAPMIEGRITAQ